jgi:hypothetical protein
MAPPCTQMGPPPVEPSENVRTTDVPASVHVPVTVVVIDAFVNVQVQSLVPVHEAAEKVASAIPEPAWSNAERSAHVRVNTPWERHDAGIVATRVPDSVTDAE